MRIVLVLVMLLSVASAAAQVQSRPTDAPLVTAENESWYRFGEPVQFAGDVYYRAGAAVFFDGNTMVRTGHYNGVPLYADTTLEPFSIVYVPIARGLMQPYERLRRGELAGTTGSRTPSFPVAATPTGPSTPSAAAAPTALPQPLGAIDAFTPEAFAVGTGGRSFEAAPRAAAREQIPEPLIEQQPTHPPIASIRRPESNDGIWIAFAGAKWVSAGAAVPLRAIEFVRIGDYAGFPVFARQGQEDGVIYVPTRAGLIAPYRRKN